MAEKTYDIELTVYEKDIIDKIEEEIEVYEEYKKHSSDVVDFFIKNLDEYIDDLLNDIEDYLFGLLDEAISNAVRDTLECVILDYIEEQEEQEEQEEDED